MNIEEIIDELSTGRNIIICSNVNLLLKLSFLISRRLVDRGVRVVIVDERRYVERYIPIDLVDKVTLTASLSDSCNDDSKSILLVLLPRNIKDVEKCKAQNIVVLARSSWRVERLGFAKYYLKPTPTRGEYTLRSYDKNIYVRLNFTSKHPKVVTGPEGRAGEVYGLIQRLLATFGEITVKDAVNAASLQLGLNRRDAREFVLKLARMGYIRIRKKKIELY